VNADLPLLPYPTQTCLACLRCIEVVPDGRGFPPDVAKRKLQRICRANGHEAKPQYQAGVTPRGPVTGQGCAVTPDDALEADLRRIATTVDPTPSVVAYVARMAGDGLACCDMHNAYCEPPGDLCCRWCTEAAHPGHLDGSACVLGVEQ
jgi:hypothetical protein